jgi:hypothetical protein
MFVNVSPHPNSQGESACSLNFAKRCNAVQVREPQFRLSAAPYLIS